MLICNIVGFDRSGGVDMKCVLPDDRNACELEIGGILIRYFSIFGNYLIKIGFLRKNLEKIDLYKLPSKNYASRPCPDSKKAAKPPFPKKSGQGFSNPVITYEKPPEGFVQTFSQKILELCEIFRRHVCD